MQKTDLVGGKEVKRSGKKNKEGWHIICQPSFDVY
jgi:hypothetical protein